MWQVIVLTCGTTTLLQCVNFLLAGIANAQCEVHTLNAWVSSAWVGLYLVSIVVGHAWRTIWRFAWRRINEEWHIKNQIRVL